MVYPPGSVVEIVQSLSIPRNLNEIIRNMTGEWVWFQSDDHVLDAPDALIRLLDRELDVVVPLMVRRRPPFSPVVFKEQDERGWYVPFAYDELPADGLLEVPVAAGTGGMLVRKHVLDAVGDPWFEYSKGEYIKEDVDFTHKIIQAGFKIYCDTSVRLGHMGVFCAWPFFNGIGDEGAWGIKVQLGQGPEGAMNAIFVQPEER